MHTNTKTTPAQSKEASGVLTISRTERWAPISGIAFVVLMVVGSMLVGDTPRPDASEQEIAEYLADSHRHHRNIIGAYLWVGAIPFLWFLTRLRNDLRRAEGGTGALSNLAHGAGVAFTAVWMVSAATFAAVPYAITLRGAPVSDPDLVRLLPALGRLELLLGGGFSGLLVLLAAAAALGALAITGSTAAVPFVVVPLLVVVGVVSIRG
jgi:hypothetical protein